jgi:hypothetical protein
VLLNVPCAKEVVKFQMAKNIPIIAEVVPANQIEGESK